MPDLAKPPDLDAQGQPVTGGGKPPDLDAQGQPVGPMTFAVVNGQRVPVDDDTGVGAFVSHAVKQLNPIPAIQAAGQMLPIPKALGGGGVPLPQSVGGSGMDAGLVQVPKAILAAQGEPLDRAVESYQKGDYGSAAVHALNFLIPLVGPVFDKAGNELRAGKVAAGLGDSVGLGLSLSAPKALANGIGFNTPRLKNANPAEAAAVKFGEANSIPVDAATATGNQAIRGVQWLADRSLAGSVVGGRAKQAQAVALGRVGGELADVAHPVAMTPEQAGSNLSSALTQKVGTLNKTANAAYDTVRQLEAQSDNAMPVPKAPAPVDAIPDPIKGQVRRMVHELDTFKFQPGKLMDVAPGIDSGTVYNPRVAGAAVYHDIVGRLEAGSPTRGAVQAQLESYLGGGKETPVVKAALEVADQRGKGQGGRTVAKPDLPPTAMEMSTALEDARQTHDLMQLPVSLAEVKTALKPIYDQMARQLPLTQRQSNPGFNAISQILDGPDWAPLSQTDRDLSAIKTLARERGGLAKVAVQKLGAAVNQAAADAGPDVARTLSQGRAATVAKYSAQDVLEGLRDEPVKTIEAITQPRDGGIQKLRAVVREVPEIAPQIARAKLDQMIDLATERNGFDHADKLYKDWQNLGTQTRQILFPKPGQVQDLDRFFLLAKKIAENPNPSGSAFTGALGIQGAALWTNPLGALVTQISGAGLSALLHSPAAVQLLTNGLSLRLAGAPAAAQAAVAARILQTARAMGLPVAAAQPSTPGPGAPGAIPQ